MPILADLDHTDKIVIADAGLPVPDGVLKVDLSLKPGLPAFQDTATVLAKEMAVEKVIAAAEIKASNPENARFLENLFSEQKIEYLSHEEFKLLTKEAKAVIRTGEFTPYANCILQAGVLF